MFVKANKTELLQNDIPFVTVHAKYPIMFIKRIEQAKDRCVVIETILFWFRSFISKKK